MNNRALTQAKTAVFNYRATAKKWQERLNRPQEFPLIAADPRRKELVEKMAVANLECAQLLEQFILLEPPPQASKAPGSPGNGPG